MPPNPTQIINSLLDKFIQEELQSLPANLQAAATAEIESRRASFQAELGSDSGTAGFLDLVGFAGEGIQDFSTIPPSNLIADFDESVSPSQLNAVADLYFIYQHERMKIFQVVDVLRRLFELGRMKVQQGPGARALYLLEKWKPLRYTPRDRKVAYLRCFNYGKGPAPAGAIVNKNFHYQFVAFNTSLAQYFRDLTIGEVIRGSAEIEDRPYGSIATIQRLGTDLRYALDRASYGNVFALTEETGHYLQTCLDLLDAADIKKGFDANTKWDVVEAVSNQHLQGARDLSQRARMAESGRRVLDWIASGDFDVATDPEQFRTSARLIGGHAEAWIAAYRMTEEGRRFPGVTRQLKWSVGLPNRARAAS